MAASSRRTEEKVASRRGSGRHCRSASRARALSLKLEMDLEYCKIRGGQNLPEKATNDMLQESGGLLLDQLRHHVAQDGADGIEPLIRGTDVVESMVIKKNLLYNENGHGLAQLGTRLHDSQAQWDNLRGQEKVDHIRRVILDERSDDTKRGETKVFEGSRLGSRVEERIQEQRNVRYEKC